MIIVMSDVVHVASYYGLLQGILMLLSGRSPNLVVPQGRLAVAYNMVPHVQYLVRNSSVPTSCVSAPKESHSYIYNESRLLEEQA